MMPATDIPACLGCGSRHVRVVGRLPASSWFAGRPLAGPLPGGQLYRCGDCFLKFRFPVLPAATYQALYDNALDSAWPADSPRKDWDLIVDQVRQHMPSGGRILDVGCYSGGLLARFDGAYEAHGVEINRAAAAAAVARTGCHVWPTLDGIPEDLRFDVVIAADVIEHVLDPGAFLDRLAKLLRNDGVIILTTGDADAPLWRLFGANWWYCFHPEHVSFISKRWLAVQAGAGPLSVRQCSRFRYTRLPASRWLMDAFLAVSYGLFPRVYIAAMTVARRLLGRPGGVPVRGVGLSADHLLVVLSLEPGHK